ncbi:MAG: hypothetical protein HW412_2273, partial [Bacteroidetes bacterium]|nr:hypothetical protein [Bacteroidota bacterium]
MKHILYILLVLAVAQPLHLAAHAQTGEVTIVITPSGSNADVSLYIQRTGGTAWKLGICSFVFNFTPTLTFSSELVEG